MTTPHDPHHDPVPPLRRPEDVPPVRTQAALYELWRSLMGPLGFGQRLLWLQLLDAEGRCTPLLPTIEDLPLLPDEECFDQVVGFVQQLLDLEVPGGSVAFLLSRPGRAGISASDRRWAAGLTAAARRLGVRCWPVHLANDEELRVVTDDDLAATA